MSARLRFFSHYGNSMMASLIVLAAVVGFDQEGFGLSLLLAAFVAAIALSVHAAERMAFVASHEDWRKAELREVELRSEVARLQPKLLESLGA